MSTYVVKSPLSKPAHPVDDTPGENTLEEIVPAERSTEERAQRNMLDRISTDADRWESNMFPFKGGYRLLLRGALVFLSFSWPK